MDEASGTRNDSHGTNHLTDNNTVTSTTGKVGNAAQFTAANSESLSVASNAGLVTGDIDFTFAGWVRIDATINFGMVLTKCSGSGFVEYEMRRDSTSTTLQFFVHTGLAQVSSAITNGAWMFVVAWHDATANTVNLQVDNGTPASAGLSHPGTTNTEAVRFMRRGDGLYSTGLIDEFGFWKRVLTSDERTELYNSGNGRDYAYISGGGGGTTTRRYSLSLTGVG